MKRRLLSILLALAMVFVYASPILNPSSQSYAADTEQPQIKNVKLVTCDVDTIEIEADVYDNVGLNTSTNRLRVYYVMGDTTQDLFMMGGNTKITWISDSKIKVTVGHTICENPLVIFGVFDTSGNLATASVQTERPAYRYLYKTIGDTFHFSEFTSLNLSDPACFTDLSYYGDVIRNNGNGTFTVLKPGKSILYYYMNDGQSAGVTVVVDCDHKYGNWEIVKPASCKSAGSRQCICSICGDTKTEEIAMTSHSWDSGTVVKPAKYLSAGVKTYVCSTCGATKSQVIPVKNVKAVTPARVKLSGAKVSGKKLTVKWKRTAANTKGYQVSVKDRKTGKEKYYAVKQSSKATLKKTIKKLKKGRKYAVRVRAYNQIGDEIIYGPWSNVKSGKV